MQTVASILPMGMKAEENFADYWNVYFPGKWHKRLCLLERSAVSSSLFSHCQRIFTPFVVIVLFVIYFIYTFISRQILYLNKIFLNSAVIHQSRYISYSFDRLCSRSKKKILYANEKFSKNIYSFYLDRCNYFISINIYFICNFWESWFTFSSADQIVRFTRWTESRFAKLRRHPPWSDISWDTLLRLMVLWRK